ncbi:MAG: glutamate racemase, partial [Bacteroidia bacterium]|nr:glutamate racemase [Bacteroidia bacterium]
MSASSPIGIFDSGIGGLTVANAIHELMPKESLIYFGDTAHLPYGDKSSSAIKSYSKKISEFLLNQNCKIIVIACNSASSTAYDTVRKIVPTSIPVINVIDPVVDYITKTKKRNRIGVIGTKATIKTRVYPKRINQKNKTAKVNSLATPLLAPMIEEGFFDNNISQTIINNYLSKKPLSNIDSLILACTHYPLIEKEVKKYYGSKVFIVNSANIVAKKVRDVLKKKKLLTLAKRAKHHFYISDYT